MAKDLEIHNPEPIQENMFEKILQKSNPKSRYASGIRIEDENNNIAEKIVAGVIVMGQQHNKEILTEHQLKIRKRLKKHIENEKRRMQNKLAKIQRSLTSLNDLNTSSQLKKQQTTPIKKQNKSKQHEQSIKKIKQKKKSISQKKQNKIKQMLQMQAKIQQEEVLKKKKNIQQHIHEIQRRTNQRNLQEKQSNYKLLEVYQRKELYDKLAESFNERENTFLEQRKRKLAQIRMFHQPISASDIQDHERNFMEQKKQRDQMRSQQKLLNDQKKKPYKAFYQSSFYKKAALSQNEEINISKLKLQKIKIFNDHVKQKFAPEIDENKQLKREEERQKQKQSMKKKQQQEKQRLEQVKKKGLQYLSMLRNLPRKKEKILENQTNSPKTERIRYENYLGVNREDKKIIEPWKSILEAKNNKIETAQLLQIQSAKVEQKLRRKQLQAKVLKVKDDGSIDQQYYEMIKAKLDLLAEH